jgi:RNA polymerase sigma factor (sigma-70 family)
MAQWQQVMEELFLHRRTALIGYAALLAGNDRDAEDLVHEALVRTFSRARPNLAPEAAESYVRRAILTSYLDGYRKRKRWISVRHLLAPKDERDGPERATAQRLEIETALAGLSPRERACVVLRYYEDKTTPEIADLIGISDGAVKKYLGNAVRRLSVVLGPAPEHRIEPITVVNGRS